MGQTKERPIKFLPEMVQAILQGRKTVTRRVIKPQPDGIGSSDGVEDKEGNQLHYELLYGERKCPYGDPGDRLWVVLEGASRITLEVVGVSAERLQDITEEDAIKEGVKLKSSWLPDESKYESSYRNGFAWTIEQILGKGTWSQNKWFWRIEFKVCQ